MADQAKNRFENYIKFFIHYLFTILCVFCLWLSPSESFSQIDTVIRKQLSSIDSFVIKHADSTVFHLDRAKEILIWFQLDTIRQKQIADFIMKEALRMSKHQSGISQPKFFQISYMPLSPLYSKYSRFDEEALIRSGASAGVTVGFDLTKGLVQRYLLKGIHLPDPGDSLNIDYLARDSTAIAFILYIYSHPGKNIMDLYLMANIHQRRTFSEFLQYLNILIRTGLISYIEPKDSPQIFFIPYPIQELYRAVRKRMELTYIKRDQSWKTWLKLQKSLSNYQ